VPSEILAAEQAPATASLDMLSASLVRSHTRCSCSFVGRLSLLCVYVTAARFAKNWAENRMRSAGWWRNTCTCHREQLQE
jgi:hypothetical protein